MLFTIAVMRVCLLCSARRVRASCTQCLLHMHGLMMMFKGFMGYKTCDTHPKRTLHLNGNNIYGRGTIILYTFEI